MGDDFFFFLLTGLGVMVAGVGLYMKDLPIFLFGVVIVFGTSGSQYHFSKLESSKSFAMQKIDRTIRSGETAKLVLPSKELCRDLKEHYVRSFMSTAPLSGSDCRARLLVVSPHSVRPVNKDTKFLNGLTELRERVILDTLRQRASTIEN